MPCGDIANIREYYNEIISGQCVSSEIYDMVYKHYTKTLKEAIKKLADEKNYDHSREILGLEQEVRDLLVLSQFLSPMKHSST